GFENELRNKAAQIGSIAKKIGTTLSFETEIFNRKITCKLDVTCTLEQQYEIGCYYRLCTMMCYIVRG
ncbi:hypothetical protein DDM80_16595, partial [Vibrio cholerae]|nr:hypothetical protein [Vibrio cholerae]